MIVITICIILILVVGGIAFYFYKKYQSSQPLPELPKLTLYISAIDAVSGEKIKANFLVVVNETVYSNGTTNLEGKEEVSVPQIPNKNIYILGYNDNYYAQQTVYLGYPVEIELYKKGEVILKSIYLVGDRLLNVTGEIIGGQYRQYGFCLRWGTDFMEVKNSQYIQGDYMNSEEKCKSYNFSWSVVNETSRCSVDYISVFPKRFKNLADRCYYAQETYDSNQIFSFTLNYDTINELDEYDEIEITFFDSDRNYLNAYNVEGVNGEDIGAKDYKFILSSQCIKGGDCNTKSCTSEGCTL